MFFPFLYPYPISIFTGLIIRETLYHSNLTEPTTRALEVFEQKELNSRTFQHTAQISLLARKGRKVAAGKPIEICREVVTHICPGPREVKPGIGRRLYIYIYLRLGDSREEKALDFAVINCTSPFALTFSRSSCSSARRIFHLIFPDYVHFQYLHQFGFASLFLRLSMSCYCSQRDRGYL